MNPRTFDQATRTFTMRFSRRTVLFGSAFAAVDAAITSPVRAVAQTPVAETTEPVLAIRSYIVLGTIDEVAAGLDLLITLMESQAGLLDYRVAELGNSTLATVSSFLGQEASDAAAAAEATWIAEQMGALLTEPVDRITGPILSWSRLGAGVGCQPGTQTPCPEASLTCCSTSTLPGAPGVCLNADTTCPARASSASPVANCMDEGCPCATGTEFPCNDGLICCADGEDTPPGGPGTCRQSCEN